MHQPIGYYVALADSHQHEDVAAWLTLHYVADCFLFAAFERINAGTQYTY